MDPTSTPAIFSGGQINGGVSSEADLRRRSSIPTAAHIPDARTDPNVQTGLITHPARARDANTCAYGPACNPDVPAPDSENRIVVPGWKKSFPVLSLSCL
ncbi:hypothetical protein ACQJBY_053350 [Aegilops geniculata]